MGEKHVRQNDLGDVLSITQTPPQYNDFCIYAAKAAMSAGRLAGTNYPLAVSPQDLYNSQFGSWHSGVVQFVFCDGSVHSLNTSIAGSTLGLLAARNDGQVIPNY
jgi:prepilin-type processing-associated H-X9-DG protein